MELFPGCLLEGIIAMVSIRKKILQQKIPLITFLKWVFFSIIVGIVVGFVGVAFRYGLNFANGFRDGHPSCLLLLPVIGLFIVFLYRITDMGRDQGTNFILIAVRTEWRLRARTAPLIFVTTILTHLAGGSSGREGAALQMGGCIATWIGHNFHLNHRDQRIMTMCGMAAGFAALFGTPIASAVFSMEVVSVGVMYYAAIVPCVIAALIASYIAVLCGFPLPAYQILDAPKISVSSCVRVLLLGILFALLSIFVCFVLRRTAQFFRRICKNQYYRVLAGSGFILVFTLLVGNMDYNGAGTVQIDNALHGEADPWMFILKLVLTAVTLGCGFKGGEITPTFFIGATFGCVIAPLFGLSASFGAALGLVSVFCGVTNAPISSIILAYELFGGQNLALFALCCAVSYALSGYSSLYEGQELAYSKYSPDVLDKKPGDTDVNTK